MNKLMPNILSGLLAAGMFINPTWAGNAPKSKEKPFQSVTFYPLKGQYVLKLSGYTDLDKMTETLHGVELMPRSEIISEKFSLDVREGTASIHLVKVDGTFVEGGVVPFFRDPNLPQRCYWIAGARVDAATPFKALEFYDTGIFQNRVDFSPKPGEPKVEYRINDLVDRKTKKIRDDLIDIDLKASDVDYGTNWRTSADFKIIDSRDCRWPNIGAFSGKSWEKYIIFVLFKGVQPYCANVYEIGKGWLNSVEIVEKLFRRDLERR